MALKWKCDNKFGIWTAKSGPFQVTVSVPWKCRAWRARIDYAYKGRMIYSAPLPGKKSYKTFRAANDACVSWLRAQAKSMLKALEGGK